MTDVTQKTEAFVARYTAQLHPAEVALNLAVWDLETTGSSEAQTAVVDRELRYNALFQNPDDWALVQELQKDRSDIEDDRLRRQLDILYREFLRNQDDPDRFERKSRLQTELGKDFTGFRASFEGAEVSDNELAIVLREDKSSERVEAAWKAGKMIGPVVAERVRELAGLRNESARALGFADYFHQQLWLQEIDVDELFGVLDELESLTREPFRQVKQTIDEALSTKFGCPVSDLRPWHYANPFFQEPPQFGSVSLDALFENEDVVELGRETFARLGLPVGDILARSDLFERAGKNQHAFCLTVDRDTHDVRTLCNLRPDEYSITTLLHELGHAVFEEYIGGDLPFLIRTPAHISTTEAIAMLMGRLTRNAKWLSDTVGAGDAEALAEAALDQLRAQMLVFVRWVLVMTNFERELYANPNRPDLNQLWWNLVERFQLLQTPEDRAQGSMPDWATKIHIGLYPCYYHNYLLGELTASQLQDKLVSEVGPVWFADSAAGAYLREKLFALGATLPWHETVERVTGTKLNPIHFVNQFVSAPD